MKLTQDQLEFAISQYLDGTLPPLELAALEARFASDPEAHTLLDEYRALDTALKGAQPMPQVAWDRFAAHLSHAVAQEPVPRQTYSLARCRRAANLALAACVALVVGIGFMSYSNRPDIRAHAPSIAIVVGPQVESASDLRPSVEIAIGPAPTLSNSWRYAETVVSRPTLVMIDRGDQSRQDNDSIW